MYRAWIALDSPLCWRTGLRSLTGNYLGGDLRMDLNPLPNYPNCPIGLSTFTNTES